MEMNDVKLSAFRGHVLDGRNRRSKSLRAYELFVVHEPILEVPGQQEQL